MPSRRIAIVGAASLLVAHRVQASTAWPTKPIRLVVGFPPGTSPDLMARLLADPLGSALKQPVIVENKPGAGGVIGANLVAKALDGHTLGLIGSGALAAATAVYPNLPYGLTDFKPITTVGSSPLLVITSAAVEFNSVADFLMKAKTAGDKWSYGSVGVGSSGHLSTELLKDKTGIGAVHIPFNGVPAILNAMISGDIQLAVVPIGNALAQVQAGRIKAVALTSSARSVLAPGISTLSEAGVNGFNIEVWNALMAPASFSLQTASFVSEFVRRVVRSDEMRQRLLAQGWRAEGTAPEAINGRMREEATIYGSIAAARGIKLER